MINLIERNYSCMNNLNFFFFQKFKRIEETNNVWFNFDTENYLTLLHIFFFLNRFNRYNFGVIRVHV